MEEEENLVPVEENVAEQASIIVNNPVSAADPVVPVELISQLSDTVDEEPGVTRLTTEPGQEKSLDVPSDQHNYRRSKRIKLLESRKSLGKTALTSTNSELSELEVDEPQSYKEAARSKYAEQWMMAFEEEFKSLIENKSWELVPRSEIPSGSNLIGHKWIGRYKTGYGEVPARFKGRLTAVGCRQRYRIDFDFETFAPVPRAETIRAALSLMATLDMDIVQIDIKTAFLNVTLDIPIYMTQPEGLWNLGRRTTSVACRRHSTEQSRHPDSGAEDLSKFGLKPISADACIFVRFTKEEKSVLIKFVDDLAYGSTSNESLEKVSKFVSTQFEVRFLPLKRFIGFNVVRDRENRQIFIS